jgi:hypothetical protein
LFEESLHPVSNLDDLAVGFALSGKIKDATFSRHR